MALQLPFPDYIVDFLGDCKSGIIPNIGDRYFELLDQSLVKQTFRVLIVTGSLVELYTYEKPVFFNHSVDNKRSYDKHVNEASKRREDSLYRSKGVIRKVIEGNAWEYGYMPVFITYTFAEHITSVKEANKIWSLFVKRLNYTFNRKFRYMSVVEFQKSGRVHYHVMYFDMPFIENIKEKISDIWGYGFINVKTVTHVRFIGGYVSKYLTKDTMDNRLVGQKAYFTSRNVFKPKKYRMDSSIDSILNSGIIKKTYESDTKSLTFGLINYKKFKKV